MPTNNALEGNLEHAPLESKVKTYYEHPTETWDKKYCEKQAKSAPEDPWGNRPPKGIIANDSSPYCEYGQTVTYNGGCIHDGVWYNGETRPLPIIHEDFEFHYLTAWGLTIRSKQN